MLYNIILSLFMSGSLMYSQNIILSFGSIDDQAGTVEILMENDIPIAGFQFIIIDTPDIINLIEISEGSSNQNNFILSNNENGTVVGFSLTGDNIPVGSGVLLVASFQNDNIWDQAINLCLSSPVFSDPDGISVPVTLGDCVEIVFSDIILGDINQDGIINVLDIVEIVYMVLNAEYNIIGDVNIDNELDVLDLVLMIQWVLYGGCQDSVACNYNPDASIDDGTCNYANENYDCNGNCIANIDCSGDCGGTLELDECGECGGSGPEENYDCNGNCINDINNNGICDEIEVADEPPIVSNPIDDININQDSENTIVDLTYVFTDPDNDDSEIVKIINENTNQSLLTASIIGNVLTLDYADGESGNAIITVRGISNGQWVDDSFSVQVNEVIPPSIILLYPNGGEYWELGSSHTISWSSQNLSSNYVVISLYKSGNIYQTIDSYELNDGSFVWNIPLSYDDYPYYKLRISEYNNSSIYDESDDYFTLCCPPSITVLSPNGGESWELGSTQAITWTSQYLPSSNVVISLYRNGNFYYTIDSYEFNDGSYSWNISESYPEGSNYKIKISDYSDPNIFDYSNNYFTICCYPSITVYDPNGGENWQLGNTYTINWEGQYLTSNTVDISLYNENPTWLGGGFVEYIATNVSNNGNYNWTIPMYLDELNYQQDPIDGISIPYKIRISEYGNPNLYDESNGSFNLYDVYINITNPNGGENWATGNDYYIQWDAHNISSQLVSVSLYKGDNYMQTLCTCGANTFYWWNIPSSFETGNDYKIKVTGTGASDFSDNYFTIY